MATIEQEVISLRQEVEALKIEIARIRTAVGLTQQVSGMPSCQKCGVRIDAMAGAKCTDPTCPIGLHDSQSSGPNFI